MSKNVLIISTSPRTGGNSDILADEFMKGAEDAGHNIEKIRIADRKIAFCIGCFVCQETQKCIIDDDANAIVEKMLVADTIVFATPVYFYGMSGQMKTMLDRSNPLYTTDYAFRNIYLLATAAEDESSAIDGTITGLEGWIECFENANLAGVVRGTGATLAGDIKANASAMKAAYAYGKNS